MLAFTTASTSLKLATLSDQDALPLALALKNNCYITSLAIMDGLTDSGAIHLVCKQTPCYVQRPCLHLHLHDHTYTIVCDATLALLMPGASIQGQ